MIQRLEQHPCAEEGDRRRFAGYSTNGSDSGFNQVVGGDLIQTHGRDQQGHWGPQSHSWLSVYCWSASFQTVEVLQGSDGVTPANAWNTFVDSWARHVGYPDVLLCGPEESFKDYFQE